MKKFLKILFLTVLGIVIIYLSGQEKVSDKPSTSIRVSGEILFQAPPGNIQTNTKEKIKGILDDVDVKNTLNRIESKNSKYHQDGAVFMNRERRLPIQTDREYYTEWTVETPGSDDRGARRIIEGSSGGDLLYGRSLS